MADAEQDKAARASRGVHLTVASSARVYHYFLGGKDNFAVDRRVGDEVIARIPQARPALQANRRFLQQGMALCRRREKALA